MLARGDNAEKALAAGAVLHHLHGLGVHRHVFLAHAEEAADAEDHRLDGAIAGDDQVVHVADVVARQVIDRLADVIAGADHLPPHRAAGIHANGDERFFGLSHLTQPLHRRQQDGLQAPHADPCGLGHLLTAAPHTIEAVGVCH